MIVQGEICWICDKNEAVLVCWGCGFPVCDECINEKYMHTNDFLTCECKCCAKTDKE